MFKTKRIVVVLLLDLAYLHGLIFVVITEGQVGKLIFACKSITKSLNIFFKHPYKTIFYGMVRLVMLQAI